MAICYFNGEKTPYLCDYRLNKEFIDIDVEYDITSEIKADNGVIIFSSNTNYEIRDILIVDKDAKISILAKDCFYNGNYQVFNNEYSKSVTSFKSQVIFRHKEIEVLRSLPKTPKIKSIKIFSKDLICYVHNSVTTSYSADAITYILSKKKEVDSCVIGKNNIKSLLTASTWSSKKCNSKIEVDIDAYLQIDFYKRVNYDEISQYINELILYMQLYNPNKFKICRTEILIEDDWINYSIPTYEIKYFEKEVKQSVQVALLPFLQNAYKSIAFRRGSQLSRNIPYIVIQRSKQIEDDFLDCYRFVECYKKKNTAGNTYKCFNSLLTEHKLLIKKNENEINHLSQEIISLRNHYVHRGYYIKNNVLKIKFPKKIQDEYGLENYSAEIDFEWVYGKFVVLRLIVIDIIFDKILGYNTYEYK